MEEERRPIVSVIVAVYNGEACLEECLDSILAQTLSDFELICVDDGSTDDTPDILREYAQKDGRIKVITTARSNQGMARNAALAAAAGKYLSFLDADDVFALDMLKDSVSVLERDGSDIVVFGANRFNTSDGRISYMPWSLRKENIPDHSPFSPLEMKEKIFNSFQNWTWNKVFRRDFVLENSLVYQSIERHTDVAFVSMALALAEKISVIDKPFVNYRMGTGTSLQDTLYKTPGAWMDAYSELKSRLIAAEVYEVFERSFLNKTLRTMMWVLEQCRNDEGAYVYLSSLIKYEGERRFGFLRHERDYYFETKSYDDYVRLREAESVETIRKQKAIISKERELSREKDRTIAQLKEELREEKRKSEGIIRQKEKKIKKQEETFERVRNSLSLRIGRALTFIPRKIRDAWKRIRSGKPPHKQMRIMIIVHALANGGAERVAGALANHLVSRGHQVTMVHQRFVSDSISYAVSPKVQRVIAAGKGRNAYRRVLDEARQIRRIKREKDIELAISFLETGNMTNILSGWGEKTIVSIRNCISLKMDAKGTWEKRDGRLKFLDRFAWRVLCVSQDVAEDQADRFHIPRRKLCVINNCCDPESIMKEAAKPVKDEVFERFRAAHPFLFISVGRLDVQKGHWHLVRALKKLRESHPEAGLIILGRGADRDVLEKEIINCGLQEHVLAAGRKKNPFAYEGRADAFVLSSLYEGFCNAVLEAMACDLPVISTDCAGAREQLTPDRPAEEKVEKVTEGDYGIVTPLLGLDRPQGELTPEEEQLYLAMKKICEDEELRKHYIRKGRECLERFTPAKIWAQWDAIIEEARRGKKWSGR